MKSARTVTHLLVSVFPGPRLQLRGVLGERGPGFQRRPRAHRDSTSTSDAGDWQVIRKAGTEIRVPRTMKLSRTVGAQDPTGFDPVGSPTRAMATSIDRVALVNIVAPSMRSCLPVSTPGPN